MNLLRAQRSTSSPAWVSACLANLLRAQRSTGYPRLCPPASLPEPPAEAPHEAWCEGWWLGIGAGLVCGAGLALVVMFALGKL